ncbi:RNA12 protein-domain-containing protein, partial [Vararia minispora EC-137]
TRQAWLFLGSVFPARFASWDLRYLLGQFGQEQVLSHTRKVLSDFHAHDFQLVSLDPHMKDGAVFVRFKYAPGSPEEDVLSEIESAVRAHFDKHNGVPASPFCTGSAWVARGKPWREDLNRFPYPILHVVFDGPDLSEEAIYDAFRPFGRIRDITPPGPIPNTPYRGVIMSYKKFTSAIAARNVNHGLLINSTRIRTSYAVPVNAHVIRDWITNHPRLSIPMLIFIFGTITYTIFDPIRTFMVEAKMSDWLDYREFTVYKWLRRNALDRLSFLSSPHAEENLYSSWQQRQDAVEALENYLADAPNSVSFVHGPQGSGKTRLINELLSDKKRPTLIIDCSELAHARSDSHLLGTLARQLGYWPAFPFLNNLNNVIDMATKGLIGQPAGLSASAPEQVKGMLDVVLSALQNLASRRSRSSKAEKTTQVVQHEEQPEGQVPSPPPKELKKDDEKGWFSSVRDRLPGLPQFGSARADEQTMTKEPSEKGVDLPPSSQPANGRTCGKVPAEVAALPVVIIRNFAAPGSKDELMDVFARWVAVVAENKLAHVIVVSDNRENSKSLAKALPSRPLNMIPLYDADAATALQFVKQRLREAGIPAEFTAEQTAYVERLGGRASDLASLVHKVRSGQRVEEAVEDIVSRGASELRKSAFGDDVEDAKSLKWSREQAWTVLKALAVADEVPYHDVLVNPPFRGDEGALRQMERAELVSISMRDGLPSVIRPGKPVYRYVFERLVNDPIFRATQDMAYNTKLIEAASATIRNSEDELARLCAISIDNTGRWFGAESATAQRARYVLQKLREAQQTLERLEKENVDLKKVLKSGS